MRSFIPVILLVFLIAIVFAAKTGVKSVNVKKVLAQTNTKEDLDFENIDIGNVAKDMATSTE